MSDSSPELLNLLIRRAPTAGNQTLYSVLQVDDQSAKDALARTCDDQPFIASAPWVLVFLADLQRQRPQPERMPLHRKYASDFMAEMRRSVAAMLESWRGPS